MGISVLSRRTLLKAGAATLALLPAGHGFAHVPAARLRSLDGTGGAGACALVAHAPELLRRHPAVAALEGRGPGHPGAAGYLGAAGLVGFAVAGAGSARYEESLAAARERLGDRRFGLIRWGAAAQPAGSVPGDAAALVLIDQIDAADCRMVSGGGVLCHFARRRSADDRRAVELQLAAVERTGRPLIYHWYDAAPGFAAPGGGTLDWAQDAAADLVWRRTASFLGRALAQPGREGLPGDGYGIRA